MINMIFLQGECTKANLKLKLIRSRMMNFQRGLRELLFQKLERERETHKYERKEFSSEPNTLDYFLIFIFNVNYTDLHIQTSM